MEPEKAQEDPKLNSEEIIGSIDSVLYAEDLTLRSHQEALEKLNRRTFLARSMLAVVGISTAWNFYEDWKWHRKGPSSIANAIPNDYTATNKGGGEKVFDEQRDNNFSFKSLIAGEGVKLASTNDTIAISTTSIKDVRNIGDGEKILKGINGNTAEFKTLIPGGGVTFSSNENEVSISSTNLPHTHPLSDIQQSGATIGQTPYWNGHCWVPATPAVGSNGVTYTASNLGSGHGVFGNLIGNNFGFKSILAGSGISLLSTSDDITLNSTGLLTVSNGLNVSGTDVRLGGPITSATTLSLSGGSLTILTDPSNKFIVGSTTANTSGIRLTNLTSSSPVTAGAIPIGVDASGNVVAAAVSSSGYIVLHSKTELKNYAGSQEVIYVDTGTWDGGFFQFDSTAGIDDAIGNALGTVVASTALPNTTWTRIFDGNVTDQWFVVPSDPTASHPVLFRAMLGAAENYNTDLQITQDLQLAGDPFPYVIRVNVIGLGKTSIESVLTGCLYEIDGDIEFRNLRFAGYTEERVFSITRGSLAIRSCSMQADASGYGSGITITLNPNDLHATLDLEDVLVYITDSPRDSRNTFLKINVAPNVQSTLKLEHIEAGYITITNEGMIKTMSLTNMLLGQDYQNNQLSGSLTLNNINGGQINQCFISSMALQSLQILNNGTMSALNIANIYAYYTYIHNFGQLSATDINSASLNEVYIINQGQQNGTTVQGNKINTIGISNESGQMIHTVVRDNAVQYNIQINCNTGLISDLVLTNSSDRWANWISLDISPADGQYAEIRDITISDCAFSNIQFNASPNDIEWGRITNLAFNNVWANSLNLLTGGTNNNAFAYSHVTFNEVFVANAMVVSGTFDPNDTVILDTVQTPNLTMSGVVYNHGPNMFSRVILDGCTVNNFTVNTETPAYYKPLNMRIDESTHINNFNYTDTTNTYAYTGIDIVWSGNSNQSFGYRQVLHYGTMNPGDTLTIPPHMQDSIILQVGGTQDSPITNSAGDAAMFGAYGGTFSLMPKLTDLPSTWGYGPTPSGSVIWLNPDASTFTNVSTSSYEVRLYVKTALIS